MASEIHVNDIGTRFLVTIKDDGALVNVSPGLASGTFVFKKPDDTTLSRTASTLSDGSASSGVMYYDTISGDLDAAGLWKLQGKMILTSGTFYTDIQTFTVNCNL